MTEQADRLWNDWVTIWQSELAALAADREMQELLQRGIDCWAAQARAGEPGRAGDPAGSASPVPTSGAASTSAPPLGNEPGFARWLAGFAAAPGR